MRLSRQDRASLDAIVSAEQERLRNTGAMPEAAARVGPADVLRSLIRQEVSKMASKDPSPFELLRYKHNAAKEHESAFETLHEQLAEQATADGLSVRREPNNSAVISVGSSKAGVFITECDGLVTAHTWPSIQPAVVQVPVVYDPSTRSYMSEDRQVTGLKVAMKTVADILEQITHKRA